MPAKAKGLRKARPNAFVGLTYSQIVLRTVTGNVNVRDGFSRIAIAPAISRYRNDGVLQRLNITGNIRLYVDGSIDESLP